MKLQRCVVLVLVLSLAGCSAFSFLFERLDWLVGWKLDQMYDLNESQEQIVEEGSLVLQQWFREQAFPRWVEGLERSQTLWQSGERQQAALAMRELFERGWQEFLQAAGPQILRFALSLEQENIEHFKAYNAEQLEEWFAYARSEQDKISSRSERLEDWFGSLTKEQRDLVARHIRLYPDEYAIRIANNEHWNQLLIDAALDKDTRALENWLQDPSRWWTEDYRNLRAYNRAALESLLIELLPTLSQAQQEAVQYKVQDWIEELSQVMEN